MVDTSYPGDTATPSQVHALAEAYSKASRALLVMGRPGESLTRAPFRLTAIHAIELYLNAFLLKHGHAPTNIRGFRHDLGARAESALERGLKLKKKTLKNLHSITVEREYLAARYDPEPQATISQPNRLEATLKEVADKVTKALDLVQAPSAESPGRSRGR